jgi:hypothetical protein
LEEGKRMKCLEELEKKVLQVIQKNKDLQNKVVDITKENDALKTQVRQFEASLLKENTTTKSLTEEKNVIKSSIEDLLKTIKSLENEQ